MDYNYSNNHSSKELLKWKVKKTKNFLIAAVRSRDGMPKQN